MGFFAVVFIAIAILLVPGAIYYYKYGRDQQELPVTTPHYTQQTPPAPTVTYASQPQQVYAPAPAPMAPGQMAYTQAPGQVVYTQAPAYATAPGGYAPAPSGASGNGGGMSGASVAVGAAAGLAGGLLVGGLLAGGGGDQSNDYSSNDDVYAGDF